MMIGNAFHPTGNAHELLPNSRLWRPVPSPSLLCSRARCLLVLTDDAQGGHINFAGQDERLLSITLR